MSTEKTNHYYCVINFYIQTNIITSKHIPVSITYTKESELYNNLENIISNFAKDYISKNKQYQTWELKILTKLN